MGGVTSQSFAETILNYCTETANHLPRNSQEEDQWLQRELASKDVDRMKRAAMTIQSDRQSLQQMLGECVQVSKSIVEHRYTSPATEAALWVKLEGVFDLYRSEGTAMRVGVLNQDEKETKSDLHGVTYWPIVRVAIRNRILLPLLQPQ